MKKNVLGLFIWFIISLFVVYAYLLNTAGAVFSGAIKTYLNLSYLSATFAVGSFILGFSCMQIPAGYLLDRYSIRLVTAGGVFLLALGNLSLTFASSLSFFVIANFIQGVGASFSFISVGKFISEWFSPKKFPVLIGLTQTISCLSTAFIHYYLIEALKLISWQTIYLGFSLFGFILFILILLFVKTPAQVKDETPLSFRKSISTVIKEKQIWLSSIAAACSFGVLTAYASFWYLPVQISFQLQMSDAVIISGMVFAGMGIGTPFFGWFSNKIRSRKLAIHIAVVLGAMFLIMGLYLPHFDTNSHLIINLVSFLIGFFLSGSMLYYTCISEMTTSNIRAISLGLINTCVFIFYTLLLFIPQFLTTKASKTFYTSLWILPVSVLVSLFIAYFVKETYHKNV